MLRGNSNRGFHTPRPSLRQPSVHRTHGSQRFQPLPSPTGKSPYHLSLSEVLHPDDMKAIQASGHLVFHTVGDTGGIKDPDHQHIVAMHMEGQFDRPNPVDHPSFFYHLGDVVYFNGEVGNYYDQFYEPYEFYPAPILAIPGNHDGDVDATAARPPASLAAFTGNFCAPQPVHRPEAKETTRDAMTQPNPFWTLEAPFVTIIGLYTNVPEHGQLDAAGQHTQEQWFHQELTQADKKKALIVALHHPIYSLDDHHGASQAMGRMLDDAIAKTKRIPDAVFTAHVHNYQRFTRTVNDGQSDREVPFIVAGAGGYHNLHHMMKQSDGAWLQTPSQTPWNDTTLESYSDNRHGFMRVTITAKTLLSEYFTVPRPEESWRGPTVRYDSFTLDLTRHRLDPRAPIT